MGELHDSQPMTCRTQVGTRRAMYSSVNVPTMPAISSSTSAPVPARGVAGAHTSLPFGDVLQAHTATVAEPSAHSTAESSARNPTGTPTPKAKATTTETTTKAVQADRPAEKDSTKKKGKADGARGRTDGQLTPSPVLGALALESQPAVLPMAQAAETGPMHVASAEDAEGALAGSIAKAGAQTGAPLGAVQEAWDQQAARAATATGMDAAAAQRVGENAVLAASAEAPAPTAPGAGAASTTSAAPAGAQPASTRATASPDSALTRALDLLGAGKAPLSGESATDLMKAGAATSAGQAKVVGLPALKAGAASTGKNAAAAGAMGLHALTNLGTSPQMPASAQAFLSLKNAPQPIGHAGLTESSPVGGGTTASDHGATRDGAGSHNGAAGQQDAMANQGPQPSPSLIPLTAADLSSAMPSVVASAPIAASPTTAPAVDSGSGNAAPAPAETGAGAIQAGPMNRVEVAKLLQTAAGSELRVGMRTDEFGAISIRAALGREQISAHISIDGDKLGSAALSTHLTSMQEALADRLGQNLGLKASVSVSAELSSSTGRDASNHTGNGATANGGNTGSSDGQATSSSRQQRESPYRAASLSLGGNFTTSSTASLLTGNLPGLSGRLDIRI